MSQTAPERLWWFLKNELDAESGELELGSREKFPPPDQYGGTVYGKPFEGHTTLEDDKGRIREFRIVVTEVR